MKKRRKDPGVGPLGGLLGMRRTSMGKGRCRFTLTVRPDHMNPYGVVHGGVMYSLVDYAMGGALASRLKPRERCATLEVKINYLAPVSQGTLRAEARVIERTKRVGVLQATVHADGDRLVALATGSFYIQRDGTEERCGRRSRPSSSGT
ncbi:MAG: PaaI family thioesterase [Candidatus Rokubacteria bacterium]|nr:PaaI family thioesterase [Candidatus Rokubacteria bacterium]MBI2554537.1 PaaI family thioesterase [Candidatus Rokubacteria bacterium]